MECLYALEMDIFQCFLSVHFHSVFYQAKFKKERHIEKANIYMFRSGNSRFCYSQNFLSCQFFSISIFYSFIRKKNCLIFFFSQFLFAYGFKFELNRRQKSCLDNGQFHTDPVTHVFFITTLQQSVKNNKYLCHINTTYIQL